MRHFHYDFQYGFSSSWWTAGLVTIVSDRIAGASNSRLRVVQDRKSSYKYLVNVTASYLVLHFLLYIDNVICNIAICAGDTILCSKWDQSSDPWQQLEMAAELKSDLRDTVDWDRKWLVDFSAAKTQLVLFCQSNGTENWSVCSWGKNNLLRH